MSKYADYVPICQKLLAICISSHSQPLCGYDSWQHSGSHVCREYTYVTIGWVVIKINMIQAAFAIGIADINTAWTLISTAARLCQILGYHRLVLDRSGDTEVYMK